MAGHGGGGVVEDDERHFRLVVEGVDGARDSRREEGRVADEGEAGGVRLDVADALGDADARAHAEAGVAHVERRGVAERVAADVAAVDGLASAHGRLHRVEGGAVRAAGAEDGRTDGKRWRLRRGLTVCQFDGLTV